eukprot:COSAG02_NODE_18077_length_962_cov_1.838934_1_plen_58_part_00
MERPFNLAPLPSLQKLLKIGPKVSVAPKSTSRQATAVGAAAAGAGRATDVAEWYDAP